MADGGNVLRAARLDGEACPRVSDPDELAERCRQYLGDESKLSATRAAAVYFPENPGQMSAALAEVRAGGGRCVVSGGRTGIAGGAVPDDGDSVVSCDRMRGVSDFGERGGEWVVRVRAGVSLAELSEWLRLREMPLPPENGAALAALEKYRSGAGLWFPVDPTEPSASFGGMAACNASGARTYRYGQFGDWVRGLTVVLADGSALFLRRGEVRAAEYAFVLSGIDGRERRIELPRLPAGVKKRTLGYRSAPALDAVDLFVGSEGTLGAIAEIELALAPAPSAMAGILAVFPEERLAFGAIAEAKGTRWPLSAIEFFDRDSLRLLKERRDAEGPGSGIPDIPSWDGTAVYLEFAGDDQDAVESALAELEGPLERNGSSADQCWAAFGPGEMARQKEFRHAVPEGVNALVARRKLSCPGLHKVGTDMAAPEGCLERTVKLYRDGLDASGLESAMFGHAGDNHLHVNILPRGLGDLAKAKELYRLWAAEIAAMGGAVAAEHGIGRLKREFLAMQYGEDVLESFRAVRRAFDPGGMLSPGVLT